MTVECLDNKISVWVNGDFVILGFNKTASSGQTALQEGSEVEFRKVEVTPNSKLSD